MNNQKIKCKVKACKYNSWIQSPLYPKAIALRLISAAITAKKRITEILPERAEILRPFYLTKSLRGFKIELQKTNTKVEV